jgi:hypothetical protein
MTMSGVGRRQNSHQHGNKGNHNHTGHERLFWQVLNEILAAQCLELVASQTKGFADIGKPMHTGMSRADAAGPLFAVVKRFAHAPKLIGICREAAPGVDLERLARNLNRANRGECLGSISPVTIQSPS